MDYLNKHPSKHVLFQNMYCMSHWSVFKSAPRAHVLKCELRNSPESHYEHTLDLSVGDLGMSLLFHYKILYRWGWSLCLGQACAIGRNW